MPELSTSALPTPDTSLTLTTPGPEPALDAPELSELSLDPQATSVAASSAAPAGPAHRVSFDEFLMPRIRRVVPDGSTMNHLASYRVMQVWTKPTVEVTRRYARCTTVIVRRCWATSCARSA